MATSDPVVAPFGTWKSPLESETVYQKSSSISDLLVDVKSGTVFHIEVCCISNAEVQEQGLISSWQSRPAEAGRSVLLDTSLTTGNSDKIIKTDPVPIVPSSSNVRTGVHEYGGLAAQVHGGYAYWSEFKDGRIYRRQLGDSQDLNDVEALTPGKLVFSLSDVYRLNPINQMRRIQSLSLRRL